MLLFSQAILWDPECTGRLSWTSTWLTMPMSETPTFAILMDKSYTSLKPRALHSTRIKRPLFTKSYPTTHPITWVRYPRFLPIRHLRIELVDTSRQVHRISHYRMACHSLIEIDIWRIWSLHEWIYSLQRNFWTVRSLSYLFITHRSCHWHFFFRPGIASSPHLMMGDLSNGPWEPLIRKWALAMLHLPLTVEILSQLELNDNSKMPVAQSHRSNRGLVGKARQARLEIFPGFEHLMDILLITYVYVEKLRKDREKDMEYATLWLVTPWDDDSGDVPPYFMYVLAMLLSHMVATIHPHCLSIPAASPPVNLKNHYIKLMSRPEARSLLMFTSQSLTTNKIF